MVNSSLKQSIQASKDLLADFALQPEFESKLAQAFGDNIDTDRAFLAIELLTERNLSDLNIEIRPSAEINYAQGAYLSGSNTIYLAENFVNENADNPEKIAKVIVEEVGHYVDWKANIEDAPGDEGAIFSSLVFDEQLSPQDLTTLKAKNDSAVIEIDGETATIEQEKIIYVNQGAAGENNGTSWQNAYTDLQSAIANARPNIVYLLITLEV